MSQPSVPKVSTCVDCATLIIGDRLRCPACHDRYAFSLVASSHDDVDATTPRLREMNADLVPSVLVRWIVVAEILSVLVLGIVIATRGCLP